MIFQESIGIDIGDNRLFITCLRQSFRKFKVFAQGVYELESDQALRERLQSIRILISDFKKEHGIGGSNIHISISQNIVLLRKISFPLAVKENLGSTLRFEWEKYIPLPMDEIYYDFQILHEDKTCNRLDLCLLAVKKKDISPYIEVCRDLSDGVLGIETTNSADLNALSFILGNTRKEIPEINFADGIQTALGKEILSQDDLKKVGLSSFDFLASYGVALKSFWPVPININLLPFELRKKPNRIGYYALIGLTLLLMISIFLWGGSLIVKHHLKITGLNKEIKHLSSEISEIDRIQTRIQNLERQIREVAALHSGYTPLIDILREITQALPDTAWVQDFNLSEDGTVRIIGYAERALDLISLLEISPLFKNASFLSAITKEEDGKDRFVIGFDLEVKK